MIMHFSFIKNQPHIIALKLVNCDYLSLLACKYKCSSAVDIMPKKIETHQAKGGQTILHSDETQAVSIDKNGDIRLKIQAKPGAKLNGVIEIDGVDGIGVQIAAPPTDGEANAELIKYLSKVLGIRKSDISLDKGSKSRQKTVSISTMTSGLTIDAILTKLREEQQKKT